MEPSLFTQMLTSLPLAGLHHHCECTALRTETMSATGRRASHVWRSLISAELSTSAPVSWHHAKHLSQFSRKVSVKIWSHVYHKENDASHLFRRCHSRCSLWTVTGTVFHHKEWSQTAFRLRSWTHTNCTVHGLLLKKRKWLINMYSHCKKWWKCLHATEKNNFYKHHSSD